MSGSLTVAPLGVLEPQIVALPPDVHSLAAADEALEFADAYGIALDESQQFTLTVGLGERLDGSWAAATMADFEPRQNGKNDVIITRELAGLFLFGEVLQIHTAHEFDTANESFLRLVEIIENHDDLRRQVRQVRYGNGTQAVELLTGQRLKFKARTGAGGRGFAKADLVVYDEGQSLQSGQVSSSGGARISNPNSQAWYAGSGGFANSHIAWGLRRKALTVIQGGAAGRFAYVEHTVEEVSLDARGRVRSSSPAPENYLDPRILALANAAYGHRNQHESYVTYHDEVGPAEFGRESLGIWDPEAGAELAGWEVIPEAEWFDCGPELDDEGELLVDDEGGLEWVAVRPLGWSIDVSPDGVSTAISCSDGETAEVVDHQLGTAWVVPQLVDIATRRELGEIVLDPSGPARLLVTELEAAGLEWRRVTFEEHAAACGELLSAVKDRTFRHIGQDTLDEAARVAVRRETADRWLWTRSKSAGDICPLVAVTLARWWALQRDDYDVLESVLGASDDELEEVPV